MMVYQISSGQGPAECELGVAKFLTYLQAHYNITVLETSSGYYADTYRSVQISTDADLSDYVGSVQWVCTSPFRPAHKRKNWFMDFSMCISAELEAFDEKQIVFEKIHSGGNGGQNVNKVETGIRATYLPTGNSIVCTDERSQFQNKQKAVERLRTMVERDNRKKKAQETNDKWKRHTRIVRGNAVTKFEGMDFVPSL